MVYNISDIWTLEQTRGVIFEVCDIDSEKSALFIVNHLPLTVVNCLPLFMAVNGKQKKNGKQ